MPINRQEAIKSRKKKRRRRILFFLVIPFLVLAIVSSSYGAYLYKKAESVFSDSYNNLEGREKSDKRVKDVDPQEDNVSILFIGIDESKERNFGDATRSDALMLATLNEKEKSVKLLSIPRDSYVYVPEVGYNTKINHAHAYGGPKASIEAVEEMLDIPVDYYVRMNFYAFIDVVNALDGIKVDVPYEINEMDSRDTAGAIRLQPGTQLLNGEEALALARTRKLDNDIERGKRQQEIIQAIMKRAISANSLSKYDDVIKAVGDNLETNMTFDEMKSFVSYGMSDSLDMQTLSLDGTDSYIDRTYYWQLDPDSVNTISEELKEHLEINESSVADKE
ncbi:transcriptional regulator [Bacillus sp. MKU004]|nr:transcriptional regulator [Bacillus sp. MKU004]